MIISIIAALDEKRGIGLRGHLPWKLSSDLKRFRQLTMGHHLVMGRKTYQSIGRLLDGRVMIVVTRQSHFESEGIIVVRSIVDALKYADTHGEEEVFVIGGGELFQQVLPIADRLYLTHVHTAGETDVAFPELGDEWQVVFAQEFPADEVNEYATTFRTYYRA